MELSHRPSLSNVTLQMVLYFNAILSILYAVVLGAVATEKSLAYHRNTPIVALFLWIIIALGFLQGVKFPIDNILGSFMIIFLVSFTSYVCFCSSI